MTANLPATAVIQVKPGIGDVIWHLPFLRAIAASSPGGRVSFLAPPTTGAKALLEAEPCVAEVLYFEHGGSELRRGLNLVRLVRLIRAKRFARIWILDRTVRPAVAAKLAGVPERIGLGLGPQRFFITNPGVDESHFHDHPIDWLRALMEAMKVDLPSTEPELRLPDDVVTAVNRKFQAHPRPWIVLGLGASHPDKDWRDAAWTSLLAGLRTRGTVFLIGGAANAQRAEAITAAAGSNAVNACWLSLGEAAALLRAADLFVGPSSGPLNLAAAGETESFGLFGSTPVLTYSRYIHAIEPPGGPSPDGMRRIEAAVVLTRIAPALSRLDAAAPV